MVGIRQLKNLAKVRERQWLQLITCNIILYIFVPVEFINLKKSGLKHQIYATSQKNRGIQSRNIHIKKPSANLPAYSSTSISTYTHSYNLWPSILDVVMYFYSVSFFTSIWFCCFLQSTYHIFVNNALKQPWLSMSTGATYNQNIPLKVVLSIHFHDAASNVLRTEVHFLYIMNKRCMWSGAMLYCRVKPPVCCLPNTSRAWITSSYS